MDPSTFAADDSYEKGVHYHQDGSSPYAAKLVNVLHGQTKDELYANVDHFVHHYGLDDKLEVFRKGALVAQHPHNYQQMPELSAEDKASLTYEKAHKWSNPWMLYYTVTICAIGAATQGWDQTGSNGANLSFPQEFGIAGEELKQGAVNGAPYIAAALVGCWLSDPLNNLFGRRGEIFITSLILIAAPIASGFTHSWQALFAVRFVMGLGLGAKAATVPMYAAEMAPAVVRGALVMGWQLYTAFGIASASPAQVFNGSCQFIGFCANAIVKDTGKIAWRLQLGSAFIPAVPLALGIFFCPESPRWYMKKGKLYKAWESMRRIRNTELQAARDLYYAYVQFVEEEKIGQGRNYFSRLSELFTVPRIRRALVAAATVMLSQQMCGINIMSFYSSSIFSQGGFSNSQALYASIGFGAINFVFAWPAIWTIDTWGRRALLLTTFPNMAWSLVAAGMCFYINDLHTRTSLVAFFVYLFTAFYSVGQGPVPFMYAAEVFPLAQREQGMAFAVAWNNGWGAVLGLTFPRMLRALKPQGAFGLYAGLNVIAFWLLYMFLPETKQLTLEELDQVFSVPTSTYVGWQFKTVLPWWIKRYIFCNSRAECEPLFVDDGDVNL